MKKTIKQLYKQLIYTLSSRNNFILHFYYCHLYQPKKPSIAHFLNQFSKKSETIIALQIGANDGITHDPIHKFIKRDKWQAVLLEPQKDVFEKLLQPLYANDKNVTTINAALGAQDGFQNIYRIAFSNARWATGLTSFNKAVLEKAFQNGHIAKQAKKEGVKIPPNKADQIIENKIKVVSISTLFKQYPLNKIDVLQIDTEGFDFEIIKLFDLNNITPKSIIYENSHLSNEDKLACKKHLISHNYNHINFGGNSLAIHQSLSAFYDYN